MIVAYLAVELLTATAATTVTLLAGYSLWAALGAYVLAVNLGVIAAVLLVALYKRERRSQGSGTHDRADIIPLAVRRSAQPTGHAASVTQGAPENAYLPEVSRTAGAERRSQRRG